MLVPDERMCGRGVHKVAETWDVACVTEPSVVRDNKTMNEIDPMTKSRSARGRERILRPSTTRTEEKQVEQVRGDVEGRRQVSLSGAWVKEAASSWTGNRTRVARRRRPFGLADDGAIPLWVWS